MNTSDYQNNRQASVDHSPAPVRITPAATQYIRTKLQARGLGEGLRIGLKKAGCSGWFYDFNYATQQGNDELCFWVTDDIYVLLEQKHLKAFEGAIVDCVKNGLNRSLTCVNPNEGARCGCGESFTLAE